MMWWKLGENPIDSSRVMISSWGLEEIIKKYLNIPNFENESFVRKREIILAKNLF